MYKKKTTAQRVMHITLGAGFFAAAICVLIFVGCLDNPYSPENLPDSVPVTFSLTKMSDDMNASCFQPVIFTAYIAEKDAGYVDSMFLYVTENLVRTTHKIEAPSYSAEFNFSDTGEHIGTLRVYEKKDKGKYYDTTFNIKIGMNYGAMPLVFTIADAGMSIPLEATGYKAGDATVHWLWDLSRINGEIIRTINNVDSVFVDKEYNDTIFLRQSDGNRNSPVVAVPFRTAFHNVSAIPFSITRVNSNLNAYCFFPITFTANPRVIDRGHIDSILLYISEDPAYPVYKLEPPSYAAVFNYADTGLHAARIRVFETKAKGVFYDTAFTIRTGINFGAVPMNFSVEDTGSVVMLEAAGFKADSVLWNWDLSRLFKKDSVLQSESNRTQIEIAREYNDTVFLYQSKSQRRTPRVGFPFKSAVKTLYTITVNKFGNADALILPRSAFTVSYGSDTSIIIRPLINSKIDSIVVDGEKTANDTTVTLSGIRSNIMIDVYLSKADTLQPFVDIIYPVDSMKNMISYCHSTKLKFTLNKRIQSGTITYTRTNKSAVGCVSSCIPETEPAIYQAVIPAENLHAGSHLIDLEDIGIRLPMGPVYWPAPNRPPDRHYDISIQSVDTLGNQSNIAKVLNFCPHYGDPPITPSQIAEFCNQVKERYGL